MAVQRNVTSSRYDIRRTASPVSSIETCAPMNSTAMVWTTVMITPSMSVCTGLKGTVPTVNTSRSDSQAARKSRSHRWMSV